MRQYFFLLQVSRNAMAESPALIELRRRVSQAESAPQDVAALVNYLAYIDPTEACRLTQSAIDSKIEAADEAHLQLLRCRLEIRRGETDPASVAIARSLELYRHKADLTGTLQATAESARINFEVGDRELGNKQIRECLTLFRNGETGPADPDSVEILLCYAPALSASIDLLDILNTMKGAVPEMEPPSTGIRIRLARSAVLMRGSQFEKAQQELAQVRALIDLHKLFSLLPAFHIHQAELSELRGESDDALRHLSAACDTAADSPDWLLLRRLLLKRARLYEDAGEHRSALDCHRKVYALLSNRRQEQSRRRIEGYRREYELETLRAELAGLRERLRIEQHENESLRATQQFYRDRSATSLTALASLQAILREQSASVDAGLALRLQSTLRQIEALAQTDDPGAVTDAQESMAQEFIELLLESYPSLTKSERRFCSLLRIGIAGKKLAETLHISQRSMQTYRHRIRRKFGIGPEEDLDAFIKQL